MPLSKKKKKSELMILKRKKKLLKKPKDCFIFLPNATLICSLVMVVEFRCENDVSCVMDLLGQKAELSACCETRLSFQVEPPRTTVREGVRFALSNSFHYLDNPTGTQICSLENSKKKILFEIPQDETEIGWCV